MSIGSDNGLAPIRRQAIIWTNAEILLIEPLGTNFSEIQIKIQNFSFMKMHLQMSSGKWRPFCPGGDELMPNDIIVYHVITGLICDIIPKISWHLNVIWYHKQCGINLACMLSCGWSNSTFCSAEEAISVACLVVMVTYPWWWATSCWQQQNAK